MDLIHTIITFLSKWSATIIPIITVLAIILPKTRKWVGALFRSLIGMDEFSKDIKDVKDRIDNIENNIEKIDKRLNTHTEHEELKIKTEFSHLKNSIMRSFMAYLDRGYITLDELEILQEVYDAYISLGGNGVIKAKWNNEILKLPNKPPTYK